MKCIRIKEAKIKITNSELNLQNEDVKESSLQNFYDSNDQLKTKRVVNNKSGGLSVSKSLNFSKTVQNDQKDNFENDYRKKQTTNSSQFSPRSLKRDNFKNQIKSLKIEYDGQSIDGGASGGSIKRENSFTKKSHVIFLDYRYIFT